jgi:hypothetical protein
LDSVYNALSYRLLRKRELPLAFASEKLFINDLKCQNPEKLAHWYSVQIPKAHFYNEHQGMNIPT